MEYRIYGQDASEIIKKYDQMYAAGLRSGNFTPSELQVIKRFLTLCASNEINNNVRIEYCYD